MPFSELEIKLNIVLLFNSNHNHLSNVFIQNCDMAKVENRAQKHVLVSLYKKYHPCG